MLTAYHYYGEYHNYPRTGDITAFDGIYVTSQAPEEENFYSSLKRAILTDKTVDTSKLIIKSLIQLN